MPPTPQCTALASALKNKGLTYGQVAGRLGTSEKHITDIFTGAVTPTQQEFNSIAQVLGITSTPHTPHSTR